jgi:hypothetical protein
LHGVPGALLAKTGDVLAITPVLLDGSIATREAERAT